MTLSQAVALALFVAVFAGAIIVYQLRARRRAREAREVTDRYADLVGLKRKPEETDEELRARIRNIWEPRRPPSLRDVVFRELEESGYGDAEVRIMGAKPVEHEDDVDSAVVRVILPLHVPAAVRERVREAIRDEVHCGVWVEVL